jgi:GrpB-like predicted nucleotidyltransferase (UPF0157 family)
VAIWEAAMTAEVDEPIEVVSYDPAWPKLYEEEAERLRAGLTSEIVAIEHFGSTSVPGMAGKPVVDLLVGARDMEQAHRIAEEATGLGYENLGEVLVPGRVYARRRGRPNFNLIAVVHDGDRWNYFLLVRDYLRAHPEEVAAYSAAKLEAIDAGAATFLDYAYKKGPFLKEMAERAVRWKQAGASAPA